MPFNRLNHNKLGDIRPRFRLKINCNADEAIEHVSKRITEDKTVSGLKSNKLIFIKTPSWVAHYWSPELTVRIEKLDYLDYTTVSCLIGPRQSVWAMFAMIYAGIILSACFAGMFGIVELMRYGSSYFIWIVPIGILALIGVYLGVQNGQRKGRNQMLHLVSFLYHTLEEITDVEREH